MKLSLHYCLIVKEIYAYYKIQAIEVEVSPILPHTQR